MTAAEPLRVPSRVLRMGVGVAVLLVLVHQLGAEPFLAAFDHLSLGAVVAALLITVVTTSCCAWRWSWVAGRLGLRLDPRTALTAYYRSQLVNQVLPGGVLGDVDRAVRHGREQRSLGPAARAVAWDRAAGQLALLGLSLLCLVGLPAGTRRQVLLTVGVVVVVVGAAVLASAASGRTSRISAVLAGDLRRLLAPPPFLALALSCIAIAGYVLVLLLALRSTDVVVPLRHAVPMLLVVLVASSLPFGVAGWGPREGAAAWVFGSAGLDAADGVTVTTVYGILSLLASAPGALVLVHDLLPRRATVGAS